MIRSRIAPTPSGYLHIGNAVNFIITWLWVRKENGTLRLRIDDLDAPRAKPEYLDDIFRTLEWLDLNWEEGPQTPDEHAERYSQLLRTDIYDELIEELIATGKTYACSCSRKDILAIAVDGQYPGTCRDKNIPLNQPETALRILTPANNPIRVNDVMKGPIEIDLYNTMRDFIIRRRDRIAAYQIASLADDLDFNINLIIRGEDLLGSTAAQLYLADLCKAKTFAQTTFYHHGLLKDENGNKLSKSEGSISLKAWRESNPSPEKFYLMLCQLLGWKQRATNPNEMLQLVKEGAPLIV